MLKCTKFNIAGAPTHTPLGELTALHQTPRVVLRGLLLREGRERREGEGKDRLIREGGEGREGRGRRGRGRREEDGRGKGNGGPTYKGREVKGGDERGGEGKKGEAGSPPGYYGSPGSISARIGFTYTPTRSRGFVIIGVSYFVTRTIQSLFNRFYENMMGMWHQVHGKTTVRF